MVKDVKIYFIGLKKELFGCFRIEEIRDKGNETGLKEGGVIEMSIYSASIYAMHALFRFEYLPTSSLVPGFVSDICDKYQFLGLYMPFLF